MRPPDAARLARRTAFAAALVAGAFVAGRAVGIGYPLERGLWLIRGSGYTALGALFLSLSATPLGRLAARVAPGRLPRSLVVALRRSFGITAAVAAILHATLVATTYLEGIWAPWTAWPYLRAGVVSLAILVLLLVTSFPRLVARLRLREWKALHRLAYVAALFLFQHLMLSPFAPRGSTLWLFALLAVVAVLRFVPRRAARPASAER